MPHNSWQSPPIKLDFLRQALVDIREGLRSTHGGFLAASKSWSLKVRHRPRNAENFLPKRKN